MTHSLLNLITADTYGETIAKQVIPSQPPKKTLATTTKKTFFFSLFVVLQLLELAELYKKDSDYVIGFHAPFGPWKDSAIGCWGNSLDTKSCFTAIGDHFWIKRQKVVYLVSIRCKTSKICQVKRSLHVLPWHNQTMSCVLPFLHCLPFFKSKKGGWKNQGCKMFLDTVGWEHF